MAVAKHIGEAHRPEQVSTPALENDLSSKEHPNPKGAGQPEGEAGPEHDGITDDDSTLTVTDDGAVSKHGSSAAAPSAQHSNADPELDPLGTQFVGFCEQMHVRALSKVEKALGVPQSQSRLDVHIAETQLAEVEGLTFQVFAMLPQEKYDELMASGFSNPGDRPTRAGQ